MGSGWAQKSLNSLGKINIFAVEGHLSPKMAQDGAKLAPRGPKIAQDGPKMGSRGRACACTCAFFGPDWDRGEVDRKASARAHGDSWGLTGIGGRSGREKGSMFGRPWPLGRLARAVLFINKNTQSRRDLTRPRPKAWRILVVCASFSIVGVCTSALTYLEVLGDRM